MAVDPAETESVDRRAPGNRAAVNPGPGFGVDVQRRSLQPQFGADLVAQGRRQNFVIQRQRRLDQPGDARRRNAVADHGLNRPQGDVGQRPPPLAQQLRQSLNLGLVAQRNPGAVGLDQPEILRLQPGLPIGAAHGQQLPFQPGRGQALGLAIGRLADFLQNRVNPVAVAPGVRQPLQHQHPAALAEHRAVGPGRKWANPPGLGQGVQHAEDHEHQRRGRGVDAPAQHHVRPPPPQFQHGRFHGDQRGGASGVHHIIRPHEIQAVGDPPGHHVGDQSGNVVHVERRQFAQQPLPEPPQLLGGEFGP